MRRLRRAGTVGRGGRALGGFGDIAGTNGALTDISKSTNALTRDLDSLGGTVPKTDPPTGGRPTGLPPLKPDEPPVGPPPHPVESTPAPRAEPPPAEHPPAPAGPGGAEPPALPREPAPSAERPGPVAPGGAHEPAPVSVGEHSAPAEPAGQPPTPGAPLDAPPHTPITPENHPAQPTLAGAHAPQPVPMSPPHEPIPDSYPGRAHPAEPPPPDPSAPGRGDHLRGGDHRESGYDQAPAEGSGHYGSQGPADGLPPDHEGPHAEGTSSAGLTDEKRDEILAMEKGTRPDPSEYLSHEYIEHDLEQFNHGGTRFMLEENFDKYGIGQRDGTSFVFPTSEVDALLANGDLAAVEKALGLPDGYFQDYHVIRVDIPDPQHYNLRIPSGNEAGTNDYWLPGGFLPDGMPEAVIDGSKVPPEDLTVTDLPDLGRK